MKIRQDMQVIFSSINTIQMTVLVFYYPCNVREELVSML